MAFGTSARASISRKLASRQRRKDFLFRHQRLKFESLEDRRVLAQTVGTFINEPDAFQGYTVVAPSTSRNTYLIDMQGREVNQWNSAYPPMTAEITPNGELIRMARMPQANFPAGGAAGRLEKFDWDGNLVWSYELNTPNRILHHDFEVLPNGNILTIAWEKRSGATAIANGRNPGLLPDNEIWPDSILEIQPTGSSGGNIVWEWHLWDHLVQDFDPSKPNYGSVAANPQLINLNYVPSGEGAGAPLADWTHFNAIDYNPELDQIMVSVREFSEVWIIDHSTTTAEAAGHTGGRSGRGGDILYRYGNPAAYNQGTRADQKFFYQHDAKWIEPGLPGAGNILVFNNGWNRSDGSNYSSVVEFTPPQNHQWYLNDRTDGSTVELTVFDTGAVSVDRIALTGDWNGDSLDTGGYFHPDSERFLLNNKTDGSTSSVVVVQYAGVGAGWKPIVGDWDGDGDDTPGFYDPATETWRLYNTLSGSSETPIVFNTPTVPNSWIPLAGDWNGDSRDSVALYDPVGHTFWLNNNIDGSITDLIQFVTPPVPANWLPIAGDWNNNGRDTVGLYDAANYRWYLNNRVDGSINDLIQTTTPPVPADWRPIVGDWNGDGLDTIGLYNPQYVNGGYTRPAGGRFGPSNFVWQYVAPVASTFFAPIISGAQRLPNGNTLINEGTEGHFFEVTRDKRVVWDYLNPVIASGPLNQSEPIPSQSIVGIPGLSANFVFRAYRYGADYAGLQGKDLTPGNTLEINPIAYVSVGLYDPDNAHWYLNNQVNGTVNDLYSFQTPPVPNDWLAISGDWDADGVTTIGLYNPNTSDWYLNNRVDGSIDTVIHFQTPPVPRSWIPIAGDWDGDGYDSVGLYDPNSDTWYLNNNIDGSIDDLVVVNLPPVPANWKPIVGDWDGDGDDTPGLYDPINSNWYLNNNIDGSTDSLAIFHTPTVPSNWRPLAGDWDGDGDDSVGLYDPNNSRWYLNNNIDGTINDLISFRTPPVPLNWQPIIGDWNGDSTPSLGLASGEFAGASRFGGAPLNSNLWLDVNGDGGVTPLDALLAVNGLNSRGAQSEDASVKDIYFADTNGDMQLTPLDVLLIINHLNAKAASEVAADNTDNAQSSSDQLYAAQLEDDLAVIGHQAVLAAMYTADEELRNRKA
jgi:hypothetical protein